MNLDKSKARWWCRL